MKRKLYGILAVIPVLGVIAIGLSLYPAESNTFLNTHFESSKNELTKTSSTENLNSLEEVPAQRLGIERLPLSFEVNQGQAPENFKFISRNVGTLYISRRIKLLSLCPKSQTKKQPVKPERPYPKLPALKQTFYK